MYGLDSEGVTMVAALNVQRLDTMGLSLREYGLE
jgi:hypothetical protein